MVIGNGGGASGAGVGEVTGAVAAEAEVAVEVVALLRRYLKGLALHPVDLALVRVGPAAGAVEAVLVVKVSGGGVELVWRVYLRYPEVLDETGEVGVEGLQEGLAYVGYGGVPGTDLVPFELGEEGLEVTSLAKGVEADYGVGDDVGVAELGLKGGDSL